MDSMVCVRERRNTVHSNAIVKASAVSKKNTDQVE